MLQAIAGVALIVLVFIDVAQTTLTVNGGGQFSTYLSRRLWRLLLAVHRRRRAHGLLALAGPTVVLMYIIVWFALLWAGWSLLFASAPMSVVDSLTKEPADASSLAYFVGYTIITLGVGDYAPRDGAWQLLTVVASLSGFVLVTLFISYVVSVLSAAATARAFAHQVSGLGRSAGSLVLSGWNGRDLSALDLPLNDLSQTLSLMSEHYLAYPILQYYHARRHSKSPAVALLVLDDALTLLRFGVAESARPSPAALQSARSAVQTFITSMPRDLIEAGAAVPPAPDLHSLAEEGVPTVEQAEFDAALAELNERRCGLQGLLESDGWQRAY